MKRILAAASLPSILALLVMSTPAFAQEPPQAGDATHGHQLFLADGCYECHGTVGQGASTGPRLAPDPLPAENIARYIRKPAGQMPPYSAKVISDAEIADIHAYLASIHKPDAKLPD